MNNLKKDLTTKELEKLTKNFLNTSKSSNCKEDKQVIEIEIDKGLSSKGFLLGSLISVCQSAVYSRECGVRKHSEYQMVEVLEIAKQLIPYNELEFLDGITE